MVENYLKYKLDYPRKLIDFLYNECDFSWESVIADIGSGTGTFTRLLLERGSRVVAIEPDREPSPFISLSLKSAERNSGVFFDRVVRWP